ncbi:hypothetical protein [uncultured Draconibacterium sp.]|uniref:hypothetical protein n=1 Tax=uncultured Draconibacterium sp. TaxID=1573823 RepID=UPI0029C66FB6|nr:hypothetical protein [uncultured Draconibacterium sp.]
MKRKHISTMPALAFLFLIGLQVGVITAFGQVPGRGQRPNLPPTPIKSDTTRTISKHFAPATDIEKAPDAKGFIQRWLVLEPIKKDITRNSIFTDSFLRTTFSSDNFSDDFTIIPTNGKTVKVGDQELKWHALDSKHFNFKLFQFAYAVNKPQNGVLFWVVTVINCPEEIKDVRLTAGCNSAGMFWVNGQEAIVLSGNRDTVVDNVASSRITLKKGKNVIRGAVVNGPGIIDFCARFLDEDLQPLTNFTISYE